MYESVRPGGAFLRCHESADPPSNSMISILSPCTSWPTNWRPCFTKCSFRAGLTYEDNKQCSEVLISNTAGRMLQKWTRNPNLKPVSVSFLYKIHTLIKFPCKKLLLEVHERKGQQLLVFTVYILITLVSDLKRVRLLPKRMVPPICPGLCSGISITCKPTTFVLFQCSSKWHRWSRNGRTNHRMLGFWIKFGGVGVYKRQQRKRSAAALMFIHGWNQMQQEPNPQWQLWSHPPFHPRTLRANSHTASCIPKHTPGENKMDRIPTWAPFQSKLWQHTCVFRPD